MGAKISHRLPIHPYCHPAASLRPAIHMTTPLFPQRHLHQALLPDRPLQPPLLLVGEFYTFPRVEIHASQFLRLNR
jgi:hypothetical protein